MHRGPIVIFAVVRRVISLRIIKGRVSFASYLSRLWSGRGVVVSCHGLFDFSQSPQALDIHIRASSERLEQERFKHTIRNEVDVGRYQF